MRFLERFDSFRRSGPVHIISNHLLHLLRSSYPAFSHQSLAMVFDCNHKCGGSIEFSVRKHLLAYSVNTSLILLHVETTGHSVCLGFMSFVMSLLCFMI